MRSITSMMGDGETTIKSIQDATIARMRCALPGIIESFDPSSQTVSVRLALRERVRINGAEMDVDIPLLIDVPAYFPGGSNVYLTYPIERGDECLVVFADLSIDSWFQSGGVQNQSELRRHSLSDGMAIIGFRSRNRMLDASKFKDDGVMIGGKLYADHEGKTTDILGDLIDLDDRINEVEKKFGFDLSKLRFFVSDSMHAFVDGIDENADVTIEMDENGHLFLSGFVYGRITIDKSGRAMLYQRGK